MSDPFLEREKELMKLNDTLNNKMSFDLKTPKPVKSSNKMKRVTVNKTLKCDTNQPKTATKDANKFRNDSCDIKKSFSNASAAEKLFNEKSHELDSKDNAYFNRKNNTGDDDDDNDNTNKVCMEIKRTTNNDHSQNSKMCDTLIETIEKAIDTKPSANVTQLSLIPPNIFRKNASAEGIIK